MARSPQTRIVFKIWKRAGRTGRQRDNLKKNKTKKKTKTNLGLITYRNFSYKYRTKP